MKWRVLWLRPEEEENELKLSPHGETDAFSPALTHALLLTWYFVHYLPSCQGQQMLWKECLRLLLACLPPLTFQPVPLLNGASPGSLTPKSHNNLLASGTSILYPWDKHSTDTC